MVNETRRYRILEPIGKGGFGTVYRAELLTAGGFRKPVALKVLNPEVSDNEIVVNRLKDEARLLAFVHHPGLVQVDSLVQFKGRWAMVMEYIPGAGLNELIRQEAIPLRCTLELVGRVADALNAAHGAQDGDRVLGLIHRDLKPSNILIGRSGEVKVLDFGIARADFETRESDTASMLFGSPEYMAPERWENRDSPASDIFALGLLLYEMISRVQYGRTYPGIESHQRRLVTALDTLTDKIPNHALALLRAMLAYNPEERPSARGVEILCREIASRLDGPWLRDWSEQAIPGVIARRKPPESDALTGTVIVEHTGTVGFPELSEPGLGSGRLPRVALLLLGGLLLVGGFAAFEAWQAWSEVRARRTVEPRATPVANPVPLPPPSKAPEVASPPPVEPPTPPERVKVHEPSPTPPSVSLPERKAPLSEAPVVRSERKSPTPTPAVKGPGGTVLVRGDATRVWLVSGTKRLSPGEVPAGSYTIMAAFPSTEAAVAGQLTLQANETVTLNCQSSFALCRVTR